MANSAGSSMNFTAVRKFVAGKKTIIASIIVILMIAFAWLSMSPNTPDRSAEESAAVRTENARNNTVAEDLGAKQEKPAGKSFSEPLPETANEADVKFAKQLIAHYAREKNIAVSAIDQTLLVKNILQLKQSALALKTKYNFAPDQELNSSEEQLKNFADLMEGESSFDKVLGISLSEFVETLSDEQLANLFPENFQELKFKKNTAARRPEFPWR